MDLNVAEDLIRKGVTSTHAQAWADLGAGSGFFTNALSHLLLPDSSVFAIDKNAVVNSVIVADHVRLKKIQHDITDPSIALPLLDGVLIANALHYIKDQRAFLSSWKRKLKNGGRFVIVEYERDTANQWIPYPINSKTLKAFADELSLSIVPIGKTSSHYHAGGMYAAVLSTKS